MEKLRFTAYAWAKLKYLRDIGKTEVSFFAVSRKEEPDLVIDVRMPKQIGSGAFTEFDEEFIADFFEEMVDEGWMPEEFGRIWCHTHPGASAHPSGQDEETFKKEFAGPNWAVMFILGTTGETTCRLKYKNHPELAHVLGTHSSKEIKVELDVGADTEAVNAEARTSWKEEYDRQWRARVYTNNNNWTPGTKWTPTRTWRDEADDHKYGPGWRINAKGNWVWNTFTYEIDVKAGITVSPDEEAPTIVIPPGGVGGVKPTSQNFRERFDKDDEARKSPIGFYQGRDKQHSPQTSHNGQLTKREKKYLKKHKTLEGFIPPVNKGFREQTQQKLPIGPAGPTNPLVPTSKLETSRNLLDEKAGDKETVTILDYSDAVVEEANNQGNFQKWIVTIPDGTKFHGVWASNALEAIEQVHVRLGIEEEDGTEPTDDQLQAIDDEDLVLLDDDTELEQLVPLQGIDWDSMDDAEWVDAVNRHTDLATNEGLQNFAQHDREANNAAALGDQFPRTPLLDFDPSEGYDVLG